MQREILRGYWVCKHRCAFVKFFGMLGGEWRVCFHFLNLLNYRQRAIEYLFFIIIRSFNEF